MIQSWRFDIMMVVENYWQTSQPCSSFIHHRWMLPKLWLVLKSHAFKSKQNKCVQLLHTVLSIRYIARPQKEQKVPDCAGQRSINIIQTAHVTFLLSLWSLVAHLSANTQHMLRLGWWWWIIVWWTRSTRLISRSCGCFRIYSSWEKTKITVK